MKKIIILSIGSIFLFNLFTFGQKISKDYFDGEIYIKIKNEIPFVFDTLHSAVDVKSRLSFLVPLTSKYDITKAESSFYFSRSDILKRTFRIHFGKSELIDGLITEIKKINQIEYVEKVPIMRTTYTPNDLGTNDAYSGQYALYNIHAQDAWDVARGKHSVIVAIVDNAIDINHPDLSANVVSQWDVSDNDANPVPPVNTGWGHGTHTSGIACAATNNGIGIASIGYDCGLMAIKATPNSGDPNFVYNGFEGIAWAVSNGASVISCSWGGGASSTTEQNTIDDAYNHNVIVIASAGNNNNSKIQYPAGYNHVVAVAAVDIYDTRASFSCFGNWVDISAPGVGIYSTLPGNQYGSMDGTSMAAPLVAGLCGLIWSLNQDLSYDDVVSDIVNTTDNIDAQNPGYIGQLGSGRINAYRAVEAALPCNPSINLGLGSYFILKTESSGTITSKSTILANTQVTFDAADVIKLLPGFTAGGGSVFHAYIDGCGNRFAINRNNQRTIKGDKIVTGQKENNISVNVSPLNALTVFPNPAKSILNVNIYGLETGQYNLIINDISGKTLKQKVINTSGSKTSIQLSISELPAGIYILRVAENPKIKPAKFMKE
jgi:hypothetical protein